MSRIARSAFVGGAVASLLAIAAPAASAARTSQVLAPIADRRPQIARLTVYHLGHVVTTFSSLRPEALETFSGVSVAHERGFAIDAALRRLEATTIGEPQSGTIDARWGLVFERADRSRVGAVYLDRFGRTIEVRGQSYALVNPAGLYAWLRARYGPDGVIR